MPSSEVVVLRPSRAQRVAGALSRAAFAAPLLLGVVFGGGIAVLAVIVGLGAGAAIFAIDLAGRRHDQVELAVDALVVDGTSYPWWAIDSLESRTRLGSRWLEVAAFGLAPVRLAAPRAGLLAANPRFTEESALVMDAWTRLRGASVIARVIDLRTDEPTAPRATDHVAELDRPADGARP